MPAEAAPSGWRGIGARARRRRFVPPLVLAVLSPTLTELFTQNVPAQKFFLPWILAALLFIYGLPCLMIRDLFVRWRMTLPGLFLCGLAYGILNEGIAARTLLLDVNVPIDAFDGRSWLGINWAWASLILPWHACYAIIFPIAIVMWLFPETRSQSWLSRRVMLGGLALLALFGLLIFCAAKNSDVGHGAHPPPYYLAFFYALMGLLVVGSKFIGGVIPFESGRPSSVLKPILTGVAFWFILVPGLSILAKTRLPSAIICLIAVLYLVYYYRLLARRGWFALDLFLLFAYGACLAGSLFTMLLVGVKGSFVGVLVELIFTVMFVLGIRAIARQRTNTIHERGTAPVPCATAPANWRQ